jgi:hypothetical protein
MRTADHTPPGCSRHRLGVTGTASIHAPGRLEQCSSKVLKAGVPMPAVLRGISKSTCYIIHQLSMEGSGGQC